MSNFLPLFLSIKEKILILKSHVLFIQILTRAKLCRNIHSVKNSKNYFINKDLLKINSKTHVKKS